MRAFLHDGKRLIITAPYHETSIAVGNGTKASLACGDQNHSSLKTNNNNDGCEIPQCASPTSSTCSIAGSVNSTFGSTR